MARIKPNKPTKAERDAIKNSIHRRLKENLDDKERAKAERKKLLEIHKSETPRELFVREDLHVGGKGDMRRMQSFIKESIKPMRDFHVNINVWGYGAPTFCIEHDDVPPEGLMDRFKEMVETCRLTHEIWEIQVYGYRHETEWEIRKRVNYVRQLESMHTGSLIQTLRGGDRCRFDEYDSQLVYAVLDTREHVPRAAERKAKRMAKAKFQRS